MMSFLLILGNSSWESLVSRLTDVTPAKIKNQNQRKMKMKIFSFRMFKPRMQRAS